MTHNETSDPCPESLAESFLLLMRRLTRKSGTEKSEGRFKYKFERYALPDGGSVSLRVALDIDSFLPQWNIATLIVYPPHPQLRTGSNPFFIYRLGLRKDGTMVRFHHDVTTRGDMLVELLHSEDVIRGHSSLQWVVATREEIAAIISLLQTFHPA